MAGIKTTAAWANFPQKIISCSRPAENIMNIPNNQKQTAKQIEPNVILVVAFGFLRTIQSPHARMRLAAIRGGTEKGVARWLTRIVRDAGTKIRASNKL